jgi:hypothetical protein
LQDKANLERQLKQLNSKSSLLEKNLEKKDAQVGVAFAFCDHSLIVVLADTYRASWHVWRPLRLQTSLALGSAW